MKPPASLRDSIEAFIAAWPWGSPDGSPRGDGAAAFRAALLVHLTAQGLRIEDFTESEYMSFELSERAGRWTLVAHEFDERIGPYQRALEFDSQEAARQAALRIVLPTMRNYGDAPAG